MGAAISAIDDGAEYTLRFVEDIVGDGDRTDEAFIYDNAYIGPEYISKSDGLLNRRLAARDVSCCAWMIEDSLEGTPSDRYPRNLKTQILRKRTNLLHRLEILRDFCILGLVLLLIVETPIWCNSNSVVLDNALQLPHINWPHWKWPHWEWLSHLPWRWPWASPDSSTTTSMPSTAVARLLASDVTYNPNPKLMVTTVDPDLGILLEGLFMVAVTIYVLYEMYWRRLVTTNGMQNLTTGPKPRYFLLVMIIMWCDLVYYLLFRQKEFRFSPYCRFALLFCWKSVRRVFVSVGACSREFFNIAIFMLASVVFCAWIVSLILDDYEELIGADSSAAVRAGGEHFGSFQNATISFFTIMTGASFPEMTMSVIDSYPWTIFVFFPFVLLTFFLFVNLMIGVAYEAYVGTTKIQLQHEHNQRTRGLALAFCLLMQPGRNKKDVMIIPWSNFKEVVMQVATFPKMRRKVTTEGLEMLCTAIDDGSDELTFPEFHEACDIMLYDFILCDRKSWIMRRCRWDLYFLKNLIESGTLDFIMNVILGLNFLFIVHESYIDLSKEGNNPVDEPRWAKPGEMVFTVIFLIEVLLKLMIGSVRSYFTSNHNRYDFVISWVIFIVGLLLVIPSFRSSGFYNKLRIMFPYLNILRMCRLLRLLKHVNRFRDITACVSTLISVSREMVYLLFISCLFFGTLGVQLFGGKLYNENPLLKDTAYVQNGEFDVLNFDDVASATLAIFGIATSRYKPEYTLAMDEVFPSFSYAGFLYGAVFFFFGVLIVFNLLTAFCIQVFFTLKEEKHRYSEFSLLLKESWEAATDGDIDEDDLKEAAGFSIEGKILKTMNITEVRKDRMCHIHMSPEIIRAKTLTKIFEDVNTYVAKMRKKTAENVNFALYVDKNGDHGTWGINNKAKLAFVESKGS